MSQTVTSDEFVAGIFATLALEDRKEFLMSDTELDSRFEQAFEELVSKESLLGVVPNFTFYVDEFHGDCVSLRDTVLAARDRDIVELKNPTFKRIKILLDDQRAQRYISRNPLPSTFLKDLVDKFFRIQTDK